MTEQLATLIRQAEALPAADQLVLIAHLAQKMKLTSESAEQETENTDDTPTHTGKTLLQLANDFAADLPDETLAQLPKDGAVEHDHYIYGTPKIHHKPVVILGKRNGAVLVSKEDWDAIQETLYLTSIPGVVDSIKQGGAEPIADCTLWSHYE